MCSTDNDLKRTNQTYLLFVLMADGHAESLEKFGSLYQNSILNAVQRLSGIHDKNLVETTAIAILISIWRHSKHFLPEQRPSILVYKFILLHVFRLLKKQGMQERIQFLKSTRPIGAAAYESFPFKHPHSLTIKPKKL